MALRKLTYGGPQPKFNPKTVNPAISKALFDADFPVTTTAGTKADLLKTFMQPISTTPPSLTAPKSGSKFDWTGTVKKLDKIAPYASNIINSFRKPPTPKLPHLDSEVGGGRHVNMDNDRAQIERGIRGANLTADRSLDENTAASVKMANLATREGQLSGVNQTERNTNIATDNAGKELDANIRSRNNMKLDGYDNSVTERGIAMQNNASANFANASDKYMAIKNQKALKDLEDKKIAMQTYVDKGGTGVLNRMNTNMAAGIDPNTNQPYQATDNSQLFSPSQTAENTPQQAPTKQKNAYEPLAVPNTFATMPKQSTKVKFRRYAMGGSIKGFNSKRMMSVHK